MQNENTKPETTRTGDLRSALLLVAYTAKDALNTPYPTAEAAAKAYADAINLIRKSVCPKTFFTPSACAGAFPAEALPPPPLPRGTFVNLPGLWAARREGAENSLGERREYGAFCRTANGKEYFEIYAGHELAAYGFVNSGHALARRMVHVMLKALIARKGHAMRNRANRKAKRAAAENVEPINPPMDMPTRPNHPEDDE